MHNESFDSHDGLEPELLGVALPGTETSRLVCGAVGVWLDCLVGTSDGELSLLGKIKSLLYSYIDFKKLINKKKKKGKRKNNNNKKTKNNSNYNINREKT